MPEGAVIVHGCKKLDGFGVEHKLLQLIVPPQLSHDNPYLGGFGFEQVTPSHPIVPPHEPHDWPKYKGSVTLHEQFAKTIPPQFPHGAPTFGGFGFEHEPSH